MKRVILLLIIIGLYSCNTFDAEKYKNNDAVYLNMVKEYRLNDDGSVDYRYSHKLRLLSYYVINRVYGESFIPYNLKHQTLTINKSLTTMADGKEVKTPENAFNKILPRFAANAPYYNNLREMVVTHTALERNATIDLDYTIHSNKNYYPYLMGNETLTASSPIQKLTIIVKVPHDKKLNYKLFNYQQEPKVTKTSSSIEYKWVFNDLPAISREPMRSQQTEPKFNFSTAGDFNQAFKEFVKNNPVNEVNLNEKRIKKQTILLTALECQKKVVNEFNHYKIPLKHNGFKFRDAKSVWESNGGTNIEKTIMLVNLLKNCNIDAEPIAVIDSCFNNKPYVNLLNVKNFLVKVNLEKDNYIYLSANEINNSDYKYKLNNKTVVILKQENEKIKTINEKTYDNNLSVTSNLKLTDKNIISGTINFTLTNGVNPYLNTITNKKSIKNIFKNLSSSNISNYSLKQNTGEETNVVFNVEMKDLKEQANYIFWKLPEFNMGFNKWYLRSLTKERVSSLELPFCINESYNYKLSIPDNYKLLAIDTTISINNKLGSVNIDIVNKENSLSISRSIKLIKTKVDTSEYADFKILIDTWLNPKNKEVILKY
ncbi:MAG: DUF3857 domain-containing protein [Bacteroidales bacterium]|nr:DUF3857 domain-containing protein [Bacteroidales bacterium]